MTAEVGRVITWRAGDPCPLCGDPEPHDIQGSGGKTYCGPTEGRRVVAEVARALLFGLEGATALVDGEHPRLDARLTELRRQADLDQPILWDGVDRSPGADRV